MVVDQVKGVSVLADSALLLWLHCTAVIINQLYVQTKSSCLKAYTTLILLDKELCCKLHGTEVLNIIIEWCNSDSNAIL